MPRPIRTDLQLVCHPNGEIMSKQHVLGLLCVTLVACGIVVHQVNAKAPADVSAAAVETVLSDSLAAGVDLSGVVPQAPAAEQLYFVQKEAKRSSKSGKSIKITTSNDKKSLRQKVSPSTG